MGLSLENRISVSEDVLVKELEGEAVLLNLETENYFGLDEISTRIWNVLTNSESIQDAYTILLQEYEVDQDVLLRDLEAFVENLLEKKMVELSGNE